MDGAEIPTSVAGWGWILLIDGSDANRVVLWSGRTLGAPKFLLRRGVTTVKSASSVHSLASFDLRRSFNFAARFLQRRADAAVDSGGGFAIVDASKQDSLCAIVSFILLFLQFNEDWSTVLFFQSSISKVLCSTLTDQARAWRPNHAPPDTVDTAAECHTGGLPWGAPVQEVSADSLVAQGCPLPWACNLYRAALVPMASWLLSSSLGAAASEDPCPHIVV
nr:ferritin-3, chloroplastic-like [Ipomoea batatas]